jgi:CheY-like chemotaxis protein
VEQASRLLYGKAQFRRERGHENSNGLAESAHGNGLRAGCRIVTLHGFLLGQQWLGMNTNGKKGTAMEGCYRITTAGLRAPKQAQANNPPHELTVTLPPEPIYLGADPIRLSQIISNLLNNAAKYTEKGGHIWLTAEQQGGKVVISVRDTGMGIAAEHLPHIFEMFSQAVPALERSQGGPGVGLALARGLVELHGGTIEARSTGMGKGSEFIVRLPTAEASVPLPQQPVASQAKPNSGPIYRILVADDNKDAADSLAMVLRLMGHNVQTALDGVEAVQSAATFRPDLVVLDIGMPKMNGYEAAQYIREQSWGKKTVLIALTGWGQEEDKKRASEAGFQYHLTKPVEPADLEKLLQGLAESKS